MRGMGVGATTDPRNSSGILQIVRDGLCHMCGACVGVCPEKTLATDSDGRPVQVGKCTACQTCVRVCSGVSVDFNAIGAWLFGPQYRFGSLLGNLRWTAIGYSTDAEVRQRGTSGGIVSGLLIHLLETRRVQGVLVAIPDPADPSLGKGVIARTREEVLAGATSRYTTTPSMAALQEIRKDGGAYAVVGLPCQVHALRKAQLTSPQWRQRIPLIIGLYCHCRLPCLATREIAAMRAPRGARLDRVDYRDKGDGGWSDARLQMRFTDGTVWRCGHGPSETVSVIGRLYPLGRCLTCLDATSELADLSIGDPWIRDENGQWKYMTRDGWSSVIVRTEAGESVLRDAERAGRVYLQPNNPDEFSFGQHPMMSEKKVDAPFRIAARKRVGLQVPDYPMDLPKPTLRTALNGLVFFILRGIPACGPLRRLGTRLIFSGFGLALGRWRFEQKRRRAAARRQKQQAKSVASP